VLPFPPVSVSQQRFVRYLDSERCNVLLRPVGLQKISYVPVVPEYNLLWLSGRPDQVNRAKRILDVVDSPDEYCIVNLGPASKASTLPSRAQIESALGNISIGTFDQPPADGAGLRAIIDTQGDSVVAFLPVSYRDQLQALLKGKVAATDPAPDVQTHKVPEQQLSEKAAQRPLPAAAQPEAVPQQSRPSSGIIAGPTGAGKRRDTRCQRHPHRGLNGPQATASRLRPSGLSFTTAPNVPASPETELVTDRAMPSNGEDLIDMTLPETITVIQLLDLAGKYMGLTYVYDPREVTNLTVALKLSGDLKGQMKVKNLYARFCRPCWANWALQ